MQLGLAGAVAANRVDVDVPAPTMLSVRIVAYCLSAVTVVMMSAPSTASWPEPQIVDLEPLPGKVLRAFRRGDQIDVVEPQPPHAEDRLEG